MTCCLSLHYMHYIPPNFFHLSIIIHLPIISSKIMTPPKFVIIISTVKYRKHPLSTLITDITNYIVTIISVTFKVIVNVVTILVIVLILIWCVNFVLCINNTVVVVLQGNQINDDMHAIPSSQLYVLQENANISKLMHKTSISQHFFPSETALISM